MLATLDAQQLRELVMQLYDKDKQAKALLNFYAKPDLEGKLEEYKRLLGAEMSRYRRHLPAMRINKVKSLIKEFAAYEVGDEMVAELTLYVVEGLAKMEDSWFTDAKIESLVKFFTDFLIYLDRRNMYSDFSPRIHRIIKKPPTKWGARLMMDMYNALLDHDLPTEQGDG